ncbi:MAG: right-handed parallel beta-helix repeat-containing protein [Myxococcales bacterium]|nr:right-handed parallel beta-helix repeat-containing protein [Myxococcales bacterium]
MRLASLTLPFFAVVALAAACTKTNPDFCGSDPCPIDGPPSIDGMTGCTANPGICTGEVSTCLNDECVDCGTAANQESADCSVAGMPVCGADHACRACAADSECTSGVCEAGTCIAAAEVAYVSTTGTATTGCDLGAPCSTMAQALAAIGSTRHYINVAPGTYSVSGATTINATVTIRADGVTFERSTNDQILDVTGGNVTIIGATVHNAVGGGNADGIKCSNGAGLTLRKVIVDNNDDRGIEATDCQLTITRSAITNNGKGGVRLVDGRAVITNSFVLSNGDNNATTGGGLSLTPSQNGSRVEFTTMRRNTAMTGSAGAMACAGSPITARNNLIFGSNNTDVEVSGASCTHSYSIIGPMNAPTGTEVRMLTLTEVGFVDPAVNSVAAAHITAASLAKASADPASAAADLAGDYDGDPRPDPTGGRADIGADEIP